MPSKVLIVDDEPALLRAYRRKLRQWAEIEYAESGSEALAILEKGEDIALILTDLNMPGVDGLALLSHSLRLSPETKRFLMTGAPQEERVQQAVTNGVVQRCLEKPFKAAILMGILEENLD